MNVVIAETEPKAKGFYRVALIGADGYELYAGNGKTITAAMQALRDVSASYTCQVNVQVLDLVTKAEDAR